MLMTRPSLSLAIHAIVLAIVLALALAAFARPSHAGTQEPMGQPGAACRPVLGSHAASFATRGDIQNLGAGPDAVVCPVGLAAAPAPGGALEVSVTVESTGDARTTCTLHSLGSSGQLIAAFSRTTFNPTPTALTFNVPSAYLGAAGSAYLACTLPPGAAVIGYHAGEAEGGAGAADAIDVRREGSAP